MKFGLVRKLVLGISVVSIVTYGTSALFIFVLKPMLAPSLPDWLYIVGVLGLGVLWTSVLGWLAARMLILPLVRLTAAVNEAAEGKLSVAIPLYRANDEIALLNGSFHKMIGNLKQMITDIQQNAAFTDQSASSLNEAIAQATAQIEAITDTVERVSEGASTQAASTQVMFRTVERAAESADEVSRRADRSIEISGLMEASIAESCAELRSLADGMNSISKTSADTMEIVQQLQSKAQEIGKISDLVGQLADQTQLLALNASIEAARGGEQHAGFAVVAGEIRKLAANSSDAGEQIKRLVGDMQRQANHAVSAIGLQVQSIQSEAAKSDTAAKTLDTITSSVQEAAAALQSIAGVVNEQAEHIRRTYTEAREIAEISSRISEGAGRMASAAQEQTAVMQEIAASSEQLRSQADDLLRKTAVFQL